MSSTHSEPAQTNLSIQELPSVLSFLFEQVHQPLLPGSKGEVGLFVRYLRRKPERGLAVIYTVDEVRSSQKTRTNDPNRAVSLTLDEQALNGAQICFNAYQAQQTEVKVLPSGVLQAADLGISVQRFPADRKLIALAASCDTSAQNPLSEALQTATREYLGDTAWRLVSAKAEPVRYKPGNRCVIRYQIELEHSAPDTSTVERKTFALFGKVYSDVEQARTVQQLQSQLYTEQQVSGTPPLLPRPLGIVETLGLTFNEAVQPTGSTQDEVWGKLRKGTQVLQPQIERNQAGEITRIIVPDEELRLTAQALARLHSSTIEPTSAKKRSGAKEAKRARERAALIAGHYSEQAEDITRLSQELSSRLETLQPERYRPAHGGFKASQLLFHSHRVFVVDFDGFCLADPALDVGYFLAYLRPSGLWYHRAGMRQWFETAAEIFRQEYRRALIAVGNDSAAIDGILERSQMYEAALIFKIATRRVNRLNSPRPQELSAMLDEIAACLAAESRRG